MDCHIIAKVQLLSFEVLIGLLLYNIYSNTEAMYYRYFADCMLHQKQSSAFSNTSDKTLNVN